MTIEQNPPQAQVPQGPPPQGQTPQGQSQGHRRRRRRRNKGSNAAKGQPTPQANGQTSPQSQPPQPSQNNQGQKAKPSSQGRFFQKGSNGNGNNGNNANANHGNGNGGYQGGGGGRRKGKQKRQQVFVGPMDHSYRTVNGNMADTPPSTMEYRPSGGNGYFAEPAPVEPVVVAVREDAPIRIYCFIDDLFFLAKINETARKLGIKVGFVKNDKESIAKLIGSAEDARPSLIVFDLNNANAKPLTLIPKIKAKLKRGTSVIGFLSHLQGDLKVKAIEAGCDMVMPRSAFSQNLPNLLRRHGLDAEIETVEA
jgi:hypothetical protein